MPKQL